MMKTAVAFIAALAAADAHSVHGRQRRQYGYGGGYSAVAPITNSTSTLAGGVATSSTSKSSSASSLVKSSTAAAGESFPTFHGTAPSGGHPGGYPVGTGSPSGGFPPGPGTGRPTPATSAGAHAVTPSGIPHGTGYHPSSGASFPTSVAAAANSTVVYTTTIYSTQVFTTTVSGVVSLVTSAVPVSTSTCTKGKESASDVVVSSLASAVVVASAVPDRTTVYTTTETLTYTLGTGSTAHSTVTEVVNTLTSTVYKTIYVTKPVGPATAIPAKATPAEATYPEGTTTISSTSTTTKYITVIGKPSGTPLSAGAEATGIPTGGENKGCAAPVTVTVTAQETVTVTAVPEVPASSAGGEEVPSPASSKVPAGASFPPYPVNNGTAVGPTGGSTGFLTHTKPFHPSGTGAVSSAFNTPSLPGFTLATGQAASTTAAPVKSAASSTAVAQATTTSASGYGYGQYLRKLL